WATAKLHQHSIRFKMDTRKSVLNLEAFREMLHISPRIPSQSFAELPFEEEILEFLTHLRHSDEIRHLTDVNVKKLYQPWRSFASVVNKFLTGKSSGIDSFKLSQAQILWGLYHRSNVDYAYLIWEDFVYQVEHKNQKRSNEMDDVLFSTIKVVSRHQTTQQYGVIQPIELTTDEIRNSKAYKKYYACATGEAVPKPKEIARKKKGGSASSTPPPTPIATLTPTTTVVAALRLSAAAKGKQPARATTPTDLTDVERTEAEQLKIILKRSRQETHISQQRGSGTDEGTGDKTNESDDGSNDGNDNDNDNDETVKASSDEDDDENDDEEELVKNDDEDTESGKGGDKVSKSKGESDEEETRQKEEESFDLIPRTPKGNINQGRGLQVTQNIEDSLVTLTPVHPDGLQESSSVSSFMTSMLNPISDVGVGSIFTTASSPIVPLQTPTPIMTPSTIATITTSSDAPIPPTTILSTILKNLPTFNSMFRFDERLSLQSDYGSIRLGHPEGQQYPHNLLQLLPLIPDNRGRCLIPFDHFINNDLEYLRGGASSRKYTTSVTKTKAADYGHIKWIEDLVPRTMWIQEPINYDRHVLWGVSYWGRKRQQFYGFVVNRESALDVHSKRRIITVTELKIVEWHNYKHLDWISVRRDDDKIYKFKEGDFKRLRLQDIKDMMLLLVQRKLSNLTVEERFGFNVSLRMFTRSIVIQRRVEDLQLGVESYQKRLNLMKPDTYRPDLKR
nr:hypothetical protein [Tanacetum cinerariifolium]